MLSYPKVNYLLSTFSSSPSNNITGKNEVDSNVCVKPNALDGACPLIFVPVFDEQKRKKPQPTLAAPDTRDILVQQNNKLVSSVNTLLEEAHNSLNQKKKYLSLLICFMQVRSHN